MLRKLFQLCKIILKTRCMSCMSSDVFISLLLFIITSTIMHILVVVYYCVESQVLCVSTMMSAGM